MLLFIKRLRKFWDNIIYRVREWYSKMELKNINKQTKKLADKALGYVAKITLLALSAAKVYELIDAPDTVKGILVGVFILTLTTKAFSR